MSFQEIAGVNATAPYICQETGAVCLAATYLFARTEGQITYSQEQCRRDRAAANKRTPGGPGIDCGLAARAIEGCLASPQSLNLAKGSEE